MNLKQASVLLLASVSSIAGFAPSKYGPASCKNIAFPVTNQQWSNVAFVPKVRSGIILHSEVEEAAETVAEVAATEESQEQEFDTSIYVGNISFDMTESELRAAFAAHGTVKKITLPLDKVTNRSRGFAFVLMSNADEMNAAINSLHETEIGGRTVYVSESLPKEKVADNKKKYIKKKVGTKIYVGNLDFGTSADALKSAFEAYGEVKDCFVPTDYNGNPRGFAFVSMDEEDAVKAIEALNGAEIDGRTLNVNKSLPKGTKSQPKRKY